MKTKSARFHIEIKCQLFLERMKPLFQFFIYIYDDKSGMQIERILSFQQYVEGFEPELSMYTQKSIENKFDCV